MSDRSYVLIAPCRDEARYMRVTLDTILAQTVPPALIVVVDDGSTDDTPAILADYATKHPHKFLIVTRANRGKRKVGPGVIEAFYE
ncbi:MAG: glycosyltransferase family 2 protein, partial [Phycisphaerae bacterium]